MCLLSREEVDLLRVDGFKIFAKGEDGGLTSCFGRSYKKDLFYPVNERIGVDVVDANFFAFEDFGDAVSLACVGRKVRRFDNGGEYKWGFVSDQLLVLPVTLFDVCVRGKFHVPSDDIQCLDSYYSAFESKGIFVHHSVFYENLFYDAVLGRVFDNLFCSDIEKKAFSTRLPQYC